MRQRNRSTQFDIHACETICLGVVITADYRKRDQAIDQIRGHGAVELGAPQGNRLPGCLVAKRGADRELIAEIEALSAVSRVEIAFAQVIEEVGEEV